MFNCALTLFISSGLSYLLYKTYLKNKKTNEFFTNVEKVKQENIIRLSTEKSKNLLIKYFTKSNPDYILPKNINLEDVDFSNDTNVDDEFIKRYVNSDYSKPVYSINITNTKITKDGLLQILLSKKTGSLRYSPTINSRYEKEESIIYIKTNFDIGNEFKKPINFQIKYKLYPSIICNGIKFIAIDYVNNLVE